MSAIIETYKDNLGYTVNKIEFWGVCEGIFWDRGKCLICLEEYTEDNCNGGEPTGEKVTAVCGDGNACEFPDVGYGVDGYLYFSTRYKWPLFIANCIQINYNIE